MEHMLFLCRSGLAVGKKRRGKEFGSSFRIDFFFYDKLGSTWLI